MQLPDTTMFWMLFAVIVFTTLVWLAVLLTVLLVGFAWGSGWRQLAARYRAIAPPAAPLLTRQTVRVGAVRYRRSVKVGLHPDGLYLATRLPFHPPLWIPWSEFGPPREARIDLGTLAVELPVGDPPVGRLAVPRPLYAQISPHLGG